MKTNVIFNLNDDPWLPCDAWHVKKHEKHGSFNFDSNELTIFRPKEHDGKYQTFRELSEKFAGRQANANFIECFFEHPDLTSDLIAENERGVELVCLGTVFHYPRLNKDYVRILFLPEFIPDYCLSLTEDIMESAADRKKPHWLYRELDEPCSPKTRVLLFKEKEKKEEKKKISFFRRIAALF